MRHTFPHEDRRRWESFYAAPDPYGQQTWPLEAQRRVYLNRLFAEYGPFDRALDLGSGEGWVTEGLAPHCGRLVSVEFSECALRRQQARLSRPGRLFVNADAFRLACAQGSFDLVFASLVLGYAKDRSATLARWCQWVRPGGLIFLVESLTPLYFSFDELLRVAEPLITIERIEAVSSKHLIAKLANRHLLPFSPWWYERAMSLARRHPQRLAKHVCLVGRPKRDAH